MRKCILPVAAALMFCIGFAPAGSARELPANGAEQSVSEGNRRFRNGRRGRPNPHRFKRKSRNRRGNQTHWRAYRDGVVYYHAPMAF